MGISIVSIGKGSPGENGVPGDTFTNKALLNRLQRGLSFWQRVGYSFSPKQRETAERSLDVFEKVSGIRQRQMFVSDTRYPNECLATAACIDVINKLKKTNPTFNEEKIDGFVMATDTNDTIFPVSGKIVAKSIGIQPRHFSNVSLACSSIVSCIQQAASWMEFDPTCNRVLIAACDITSRLHQPQALKQPFLFGDQAVAMILERKEGKGGFSVSNIYVDSNAPDIFHVPLYTGDSPSCKSNFSSSNFGNDTNLKNFGKYEARAVAGLYSLYMQNSSRLAQRGHTRMVSSSNGSSGVVVDGEYFIAPQIAKKIAQDGAKAAGLDCNDLTPNTVESTVPNYAICGAAGTPLAMHNLAQQTDISNTRFTSFICAIGGISSMLTYDPNQERGIAYEYPIDDAVINFASQSQKYTNGNGNGGESHLPVIEATVNTTAINGEKYISSNKGDQSTTIGFVSSEIRRILSL